MEFINKTSEIKNLKREKIRLLTRRHRYYVQEYIKKIREK
jgi:glutathione synthase/RimK-type ligase-like ATP-grasp enzyme